MNRRSFTRAVAAASFFFFTRGTPGKQAAFAAACQNPVRPKVRGVNLGGWLVLEKWIKPSLFADLKAEDETQLGAVLGPAAVRSHLLKHRESFIKESDFKWIAERGLNALRIPVGHWILEPTGPLVNAPEVLDWALLQANKYGLKVLLDLHGAPGSQNGWDHSGKQGPIEWHLKKENIARTLAVLEQLAKRYRNAENLLGIELLNEPHWTVPLDVLKEFYKEGYKRVHRYLGPERVVVFHDAFRPLAWSNFMKPPDFKGILQDTHLYQCFTAEDQKRDISEHLRVASVERKKEIESMQKEFPVYVGEWSLALAEPVVRDHTGYELDIMRRAFGGAQLVSYETAAGWFFWTYKTEKSPEWSLRDCVERGWLPNNFN
ncbi:MAG: glycoside hydrolase family 5 protein [Pyrinomonadaceae bacterium]